MKKIRVGIIGQGKSGHDIHADTMRLGVPDMFQVVAVADPIKGKCDDAVKEWGAVPYSDYKEMLKRDDLDLVVNSSFSHLHVPITLEVMDAGHNVLCEKPVARTVEEFDSLTAKAKETGKFFAIYHQSRFAPEYTQIQKVIDSGLLGRIVMVKGSWSDFSRRWDWQTIQEFNGGNLLNTGPHPVDQLLGIFGRDTMPKIVCIMDRANSAGDAEDHVKMLMYGEGRPTIDLEISSCCAYPLFTYQIYGTRGGLTGNARHMDWKYFKPEETPEMHLSRESLPGRQYCIEQLAWHEESWDLPVEEAESCFSTRNKLFYVNLYHALADGAPLEVVPEHARQVVAVMEECHRQSPLSLKYFQRM